MSHATLTGPFNQHSLSTLYSNAGTPEKPLYVGVCVSNKCCGFKHEYTVPGREKSVVVQKYKTKIEKMTSMKIDISAKCPDCNYDIVWHKIVYPKKSKKYAQKA